MMSILYLWMELKQMLLAFKCHVDFAQVNNHGSSPYKYNQVKLNIMSSCRHFVRTLFKDCCL
jgi:hypothetical protein